MFIAPGFPAGVNIALLSVGRERDDRHSAGALTLEIAVEQRRGAHRWWQFCRGVDHSMTAMR